MRVVLLLTPGCDVERALDEVLWPVMSPFGNHPYLALSNGVHCLIVCNGVQCSFDGSEPLAGNDSRFHKTNISGRHLFGYGTRGCGDCVRGGE